MKQHRLDAVLGKLQEKNITQMLISDPVAILYLTGKYIDPDERFYGLYVNTKGDCRWFVNNMFSVEEDPEVERVGFSDTDDYMSLLLQSIDKGKTLGVDKNLPAKFLVPILKQASADNIVITSSCIDEVRAIKDAEEIQRMRESSQINDRAMGEFRKLLQSGVTEIEVANQMLDIYSKLGAQSFSFEPTVSFGTNTADNHHNPDNTPLKEGDVVMLDVGCRKDWYCSDMTRMFFYRKEPTDFQRQIYQLARRATETAESVCRPGITMAEIDLTARRIISDQGYGPNFLHRTGHFIGLEDHDYGDVSSTNMYKAVPGNIFSIEPSITLDGQFNMTVEDLVLITEEGHEVLNQYSHEIDVVE